MSNSDDFESTIPINLSKLDPYKEPEKESDSENPEDSSELSFVDLDAELDSIDIDSLLDEEKTDPNMDFDSVEISPEEPLVVDNIDEPILEITDEFDDLDAGLGGLDAGSLLEEEKTDPNMKVEDFSFDLDESVQDGDTDSLEVDASEAFADFDAELDGIDADSLPEEEKTDPNMKVEDFSFDLDESAQDDETDGLAVDASEGFADFDAELDAIDVDSLPQEEKIDPNMNVEDFNIDLDESVLEEDKENDEVDASEDFEDFDTDLESLDIDSMLHEVDTDGDSGVMDDAPMPVHEDNQPDTLGISAVDDANKETSGKTEHKSESIEKALQSHHIEPSDPEIPIPNKMGGESESPTTEFDEIEFNELENDELFNVDAVMEENEVGESEKASGTEDTSDDFEPDKPEAGSKLNGESSKAVEADKPVQSQSSNKASLITGTIGLLIGLGGTWMAFTANGQVETLEQQLQAVKAQLQVQVTKNAKLSKELKLAALAPAVEPKQEVTAGKEMVKEETAVPVVEETVEVKAVEREVPDEVVTTPKVITPQTPVASTMKPVRSGDWLVNITSETTRAAAEKMQSSLNASGANSIVSEAEINGRTWYRVQVVGFDSKEEAKDYVMEIELERGIKGVWVAKNKG